MKICIGDLLLVDTSDGSGSAISDMKPAVTRMIQDFAPVRATEMQFFFRGNKKTEFSFSISKPNASPAVAVYETFILESTIPADAALVITPAGSVATITIPGQLKQVGSRLIGSRTFHDYTFVGGIPVAAGFVIDAESGQPLTDEDGNTIID